VTGVRGYRKWTRDDAFAALREFVAREGHPPSCHEWRRKKLVPSASSIFRVCEETQWDEILVRAGLEPTGYRRVLSRPREPTAEEERIAAAMNAALEGGATYREAGEPYGLSHNGVRYRVFTYRCRHRLAPLPPRPTGRRPVKHSSLTIRELEALQLADPSRDP
jgi:hypothetical protein